MTTTEMRAALSRDGRYLIGAHERPDGDSVGSMLALRRWLRARGAPADVVVPGGVGAPYDVLPDAKGALNAFPSDTANATLVIVDTPARDRIAGADGLPDRIEHLLVIDHHPDNNGYGTLNLVDTTASSAALLVFETLTSSDDEASAIDEETAALLYVGVMTDTGAFRFGNTDARTLRAAARLVELGAGPAQLSNIVYGSQPIGRLRLLGLVLSSVVTEADGAVAFLTLTDEMRARTGASGEEIEGLASYGRLVDGVEVAVLLREEGKDVRLSMRSQGRVDVNVLARRLGGGGHRSASGALIPGPVAEAKDRVLEALEGLLP
jgi:phosphoesterase RecJ-like protein